MRVLIIFFLSVGLCCAQSVSYNKYTTDPNDVNDHHSFSGAYSDNLAVPTDVTITTAGTFYKIPFDNALLESGAGWAEFNDTNDSIDIGMPGTYSLQFGVSMSGTAGAVLEFRAHNNESQCNCVTQRKIGLQTDIGAASGMTIFSASEGDQITIRVTSDDNGDVVNVRAIQMIVHKLKDN